MPAVSLDPPDAVADAADDPVDRRERRRRRTRALVAEAALRLADERGYDHVTVDDIAEAADIAPRTFFRYFATKDDAFFVDHGEQLAHLRRELDALPDDAPVAEGLARAVLAMVQDAEPDRERAQARARLVDATPALRARSLERQAEWRDALAGVVGDRLGVDPTTDVRPLVVAAATLGAVQAAVHLWVTGRPDAELADVVAEALDVLHRLADLRATATARTHRRRR